MSTVMRGRQPREDRSLTLTCGSGKGLNLSPEGCKAAKQVKQGQFKALGMETV